MPTITENYCAACSVRLPLTALHDRCDECLAAIEPCEACGKALAPSQFGLCEACLDGSATRSTRSSEAE
ncbi:MAG: hypothetical protein ACXWVD_00095 [Telluria sp.]